VTALNVAVTEVEPVTVVEHPATPEHAPDHPLNAAPAPAVWLSVSVRLAATCTLQVAVQLMPLPESETVPEPDTDIVTV